MDNYYTGDINPLKSFFDGIAMYDAMQQRKIQREEQSRQMARQKQFISDLDSISQNPNTERLSKIYARYPEYYAQYKQSYDALSDKEKATTIGRAQRLYSAMLSGNKEAVLNTVKIYQDQEKENGNDEEAKRFSILSDAVEKNPSGAKKMIESYLLGVLGPKEFGATFLDISNKSGGAEQQKEYFDIQKKKYDAEKAKLEALAFSGKNQIERNEAQAKLEKLNLEKRKLEGEISANEREKYDLQSKKEFEKTSKIENAENVLNAISSIKTYGEGTFNSVFGATTSWLTKPITTRFSQNAANLETAIKNVSNQYFPVLIDKLRAGGNFSMAGLTEKEGDSLKNSVVQLSGDDVFKQSPEKYMENLSIVENLLKKHLNTLKKSKADSGEANRADAIQSNILNSIGGRSYLKYAN